MCKSMTQAHPCTGFRCIAVTISYQKALRAMSVIHIQSGQNPMNRITLNVNEEVPVAT